MQYSHASRFILVILGDNEWIGPPFHCRVCSGFLFVSSSVGGVLLHLAQFSNTLVRNELLMMAGVSLLFAAHTMIFSFLPVRIKKMNNSGSWSI